MQYPPVDAADLVRRLEPPSGAVDAVIDTDAFNEIDDQFAIVHALLSDNLRVEAISAAPFYGGRRPATDAGDGMEQSYREILRMLELTPGEWDIPATKGSTAFMEAPFEPVESEAANDLIARALAPRDAPLYVVALGALTNVASAMLIEPRIIPRIAVVPLGGSTYESGSYYDFNFRQDVHAVRVVFDSGAAVIHVPGYFVSEMMRTTLPEMATHVRGRGAVGDYLYEIYREWTPDTPAKSKPIWDMTNIAYLIDPSWTESRLSPSPIINANMRYGFDASRHLVRALTRVDRDAAFADLFAKLDAATRRG